MTGPKLPGSRILVVGGTRAIGATICESLVRHGARTMLTAGYGVPGLPAYSAAKAGIEGVIRQLATEYGSEGIHFECISMGPVNDAGDTYTPGLPHHASEKPPRDPDVTVIQVANAVAHALHTREPHANGNVRKLSSYELPQPPTCG